MCIGAIDVIGRVGMELVQELVLPTDLAKMHGSFFTRDALFLFQIALISGKCVLFIVHEVPVSLHNEIKTARVVLKNDMTEFDDPIFNKFT